MVADSTAVFPQHQVCALSGTDGTSITLTNKNVIPMVRQTSPASSFTIPTTEIWEACESRKIPTETDGVGSNVKMARALGMLSWCHAHSTPIGSTRASLWILEPRTISWRRIFR